MKKILVSLCVFTLAYVNISAQEWKWFNASNTVLPSNNVNSLTTDHTGKVYAGTVGGLAVCANDSWQRMNVGNQTNLQIIRVVADSANLYVGTQSSGLWGLSNNTWKNYDPNTLGNTVNGIGIDSRDSIYRLTSSFERWTGSAWKVLWNYFSQAANLFIDRSDNVWLLSGNAGMAKYKDGEFKTWSGNYQPASPDLLPSGSLYDMVQDNAGNYWIASDEGLIKFDGVNFQLFNPTNSGISSKRTRCIAIDKKGALWIGTYDAGVSKFDNGTWKNYNSVNSPLISPLINDIIVDSANRIWIANGYNYAISPGQGQGIFRFDESVDLSLGQLPRAPANLKGKVISINEIRLSWGDSSNNEAGFILERSTGNSNNFQPIKMFTSNAVNFTDLSVSANTVYYYRISAFNNQGSSGYSNILEATAKYCTVNTSGYQSYAGLRKVSFGNINNQPLNCISGYYEYLDQKTDLFKGQTLTLYISIDRCTITSDEIIGTSAYIDWNNDGDFDDNGELVFTKTNIDGKGEFYIPVTVPSNVIVGTTIRMRLRSEDDVYSNTIAISPCGFAEETQDYSLVIVAPPSNNTPSSLITRNISSRSQLLQWQDNADGETGYSVQRSTDNLNYVSIGSVSANTITFKDSLLQPDTRYYYKVLVKTATDSASGPAYSSNTLSLDLIRQLKGGIATDKGFNTGAYWGDFNNDGKYDMYAPGNDRLYVNMSDSLSNSQLAFMGSSTAAWGDFDNDGDEDLYVGDYLYGGSFARAALFENQGNGSFTMSSPIVPDGRVANSVWTDYNNDGYLDLYISYIDLAYGKLYRNNRDKSFSLVRKFDNANGYASFADYDNDGDDDLFVIGQGLSYAFKRQDSSFTSVSVGLGQEYCRGVSWADFDNDGDIDVFVPSSNNGISGIYVNGGSGTFVKFFSYFASTINTTIWSSSWGDIDNDGLQDLFFTHDSKPLKLMRNRLNRFDEMPNSIFLNEDYSKFPYAELPALGAAMADYNNDGFLDLYVAVSNGFPSRLYKNGTNQYNWINITLKGTISNKDAIGAKVKIKANGQWQYRWIQSGSGYSAHNSFAAEFGLGSAAVIDSIVVRWPSGIEQVMTTVNKNQFITITEASKPTAVIDPLFTSAKVFPNPASKQVYVTVGTNQFIKTKTAYVYDITGTMRQLGLKQVNGNTYSVDVNGLPVGVYFLEIKEKQLLVRKKILVVR